MADLTSRTFRSSLEEEARSKKQEEEARRRSKKKKKKKKKDNNNNNNSSSNRTINKLQEGEEEESWMQARNLPTRSNEQVSLQKLYNIGLSLWRFYRVNICIKVSAKIILSKNSDFFFLEKKVVCRITILVGGGRVCLTGSTYIFVGTTACLRILLTQRRRFCCWNLYVLHSSVIPTWRRH